MNPLIYSFLFLILSSYAKQEDSPKHISEDTSKNTQADISLLNKEEADETEDFSILVIRAIGDFRLYTVEIVVTANNKSQSLEIFSKSPKVLVYNKCIVLTRIESKDLSIAVKSSGGFQFSCSNKGGSRDGICSSSLGHNLLSITSEHIRKIKGNNLFLREAEMKNISNENYRIPDPERCGKLK